MFDVTPDEIASLNDTDLRELVGRLCEAELSSLGHSPAAVTWGGNQTAADGGLDVRVAATPGAPIDGFIPRPSTGFQVKTPDMPRAEILSEMRSTREIRPVIQQLADEGGAYVIVSSHGSVADIALQRRREAMREALAGVVNADRLVTDFYDRTRLAAWVRRHPGLITWVKEKLGRATVGWRPYGPWSGPAEGAEAEYLVDDKLTLHMDDHGDGPAPPMIEAIDKLRDELALPGKMVRLVGLSGVGKTRLVQALFDARVGSRPLPPSLAVYTNLSDNPTPQPTGLASDLIANRTRAILIVDNCTPDLHRSLSDLCGASGSTVSVITVEYDVRDDQPEGTRVVTLDTSSPELIEKLVKRRFPNLSAVDASTISVFSGGNARIAIALAGTIERSETIAGLSDDELFQRLFRQRHAPDGALLLAAQACSLVYSFQGETLTGEEAELQHLASLVDQTPTEVYRHVGELQRRDLVQQRGVWRAILPHAIANRLAARALEDVPYDLIDIQLVTGGTDRLAKSFSRRLSFLHAHPRAIAIAERWLAPGGLLGDVTTLNDRGRAMFENVASISPEAALAALERVGTTAPELAAAIWRQYRLLLRSLAFDPRLFNRSATLLARGASECEGEHDAKNTIDVFLSLFTIYLSGTHATINQRLEVIEPLLRSAETKQRSLGLAALAQALKAWHFSSAYRFEFGARSRDYGYLPRSHEDVARWYGASLALIERLALVEGLLKNELRELLARNFREIWTKAKLFDQLEDLFRRFSGGTFWREGWIACRSVLHFDKDRLAPEVHSRLSALEAELRPANLADQIRAIVLGDGSGRYDLVDFAPGDDIKTEWKRLSDAARDFGAAVVNDKTVFPELVLDILRGGSRAWEFGRGLAHAAEDGRGTWAVLVNGLGQLPPGQPNVQVLKGYLAELWNEDRDMAQELLDAALVQPTLVPLVPALHSAVQLDTRGVDRLKRTLLAGEVPIWAYQSLAWGQTTDQVPGVDLRELLLLILKHPDGFPVALEILYMRLFSDATEHRTHEPEIIEIGRDLLLRVVFGRNSQTDDHRLSDVARACLVGPDAAPIASALVTQLRRAVASYEAHAIGNDGLLKGLLTVQPVAALDALFAGDEAEQRAGIEVFDDFDDHLANPADAISCEVLIDWCERDRSSRFPLAASIVTFARRAEENGPPVWSEQARSLLAHAPDPKSVLAIFVDRIRLMSGFGSRAALMEANAGLLDNLAPDASEALLSFAVEAKRQLQSEIARERQRETERDRTRNERFE